jgi:two-component system response regulator PilR (NtrC family)
VARLLIVDDERSMREFLGIAMKRMGHEVTEASSLDQARELYASVEYDLVITDLRMPGSQDGLVLLDEILVRRPGTPVIVMTAFASRETALAALKRGAYDYLGKPFKMDEMGVIVQRALDRRALLRENEKLRRQVASRHKLDRLLGKSDAMQRVFDLVRTVAQVRTNVLIVGESGTGKELVARALHNEGPRSAQPFVGVNCGAIPEQLLESELFGHVRGAFTGAIADREGLFVAAHGGTLFLDEIGEIPPALQVKLLRVLQERRVRPVGGTTERDVDVRVIAATNRDLEAEVARGTFRRDLYYRLNVISIALPPLRHRREDIPLLIDHFVARFARELGKPIEGLTPDALTVLCNYRYPGNVRELENLIERAVTLSQASRLGTEGLPTLRNTEVTEQRSASETDLPEDGLDLDAVLADVERSIILRALGRTNGVRKQAAKLLKVTFRSLRYRLDKLGIVVPGDEPAESDGETPPQSSSSSSGSGPG